MSFSYKSDNINSKRHWVLDLLVMNTRSLFFLLIVFHACTNTGHSQLASNTLLLDDEVLNHNKAILETGENPNLTRASEMLLAQADKILSNGPYSVTYKKTDQVPEGGTIHDFYSLAPYWWPDPSKSDGLPFIQRDGKINHMRDSIPDNDMMGSLCSDVYTLGLAYFYSGDEVYATKAKDLLKVFFFDEETRMNPNFNFSQYINGHPGSGGNTITSRIFLDLLDGVALIKPSVAWTDSDDTELKGWFREFLSWMTDSEKGKKEAQRTNNIGTYYTAQVVGYAMYVGDSTLAKRVFEEQAYDRVSSQIDEEGNMPEELARAKPYSYIIFNTEAFIQLDKIGRRLGYDLWNYRGNRGGSIRQAVGHLNDAALSERSVSFGRERVNPSSVRLVLSKYANYISRSSDSVAQEQIGNRVASRAAGNRSDGNRKVQRVYQPSSSDVRDKTYMDRLTSFKF